MVDPKEQRRFALDVVRRLREAGFEALWAGGCVRDELLGRVPKDYDVATNATPPQIRDLFGHRRTLAIGAAFGVITVRGPGRAGMIETATFRRDAAYSDGRHPDHVTFSGPAEDAARRDFTINGLFYDPIAERIIDYVEGQVDLDRHLVRAIGSPRERIAEDKLRMLRAVRFAATFDFALDEATEAAIAEMAPQITVVSPERIAMEMRRMLVEPGRARAIELLIRTGLAGQVFVEIVPQGEENPRWLDAALGAASRLREPDFPLALATLLAGRANAATIEQVGLRWRLANKEIDRAAWLVEHFSALAKPRTQRWSQLQPLLVAAGRDDLLALHEVVAAEGPEEADYCRTFLAQPADTLDPPPLLTGNDLLAHGVPQGPRFKPLLERLRAAQLDREISSRDEALAFVDHILKENS